jgi:hypothetical protein
MRRVACVLVAVALCGCAGFKGYEPATPPDYEGVTVNVADQVWPVGGELSHVFEMTQVDGRRLSSTSIATVHAGQGRGFSTPPLALTNELPLRPVRVQLQVVTQYATPLLAVKHPTCRNVGEVAFTPQDGRAYRVTGRIDGGACEAWIEDLATQQPVTDKVSGPGTK